MRILLMAGVAALALAAPALAQAAPETELDTLVDGETIGYTDHWHFGFPCCAPN